MNLLIVVLFLAIVIGCITALQSKKKSKNETIAFTARGPLFTPAERSFLGVLEQAIEKEYRIFGKSGLVTW